MKGCFRLYSHLSDHSPSEFKVIILQTMAPPILPPETTDNTRKIVLDNARRKLGSIERLWMWNNLCTIWPDGLNTSDGFDSQNRKPRRRASRAV